MTWQIFYLCIAILSIRHAYNFYKSQDGELRKASVWFYSTLAFGLIFRVLGEYLGLSNIITGYVSSVPLLFAIVYLTVVVEIDIYARRRKK
jgi:tryptophan-rich sensory protein